MADITENYPGAQTTPEQHIDAAPLPAGASSDNWVTASDLNTVADVVSALGRAARLTALLTAVAPATQALNGEAFRLTGIDGTTGLGSVSTDLSAELDRWWAAAIEKVEQGGDLDGTASGTALFGVQEGTVSGTFTTGTLYGLSSDGSLITYTGGALPPVAIGLNTTTAYVDMTGRTRADNATVAYDANGALNVGSPLQIDDLTVNNSTVLNESGGDNDTRIEGDTDPNLIFVDAGTDRVGIGDSTPSAKLDVNGDLHVQSTDGIDVNPGSDVDADLLTVGVTGTPTVAWDESEDSFNINKTLDITGGDVRMDNTQSVQIKDTAGTYRVILRLDGTDRVCIVNNSNGDGGPIDFNNATGALNNMTLEEDGDLTLVNGHLERHTDSGITASTTQTQGNGALTADINEVSTVANHDDTVTLPTAAAGRRVTVMNEGANVLQIFPASGDDLGRGVDVAERLLPGSQFTYTASDATNWIRNSVIQTFRNEVTTTDGTLTTIATIPVPDDTIYCIDATLAGRRTDAADRVCYGRRALVYREGGGSATIEGVVDSYFTRESSGPYNATIDVSGNNILLQVQGQAANTVDWTSQHNITEVM